MGSNEIARWILSSHDGHWHDTFFSNFMYKLITITTISLIVGHVPVYNTNTKIYVTCVIVYIS